MEPEEAEFRIRHVLNREVSARRAEIHFDRIDQSRPCVESQSRSEAFIANIGRLLQVTELVECLKRHLARLNVRGWEDSIVRAEVFKDRGTANVTFKEEQFLDELLGVQVECRGRVLRIHRCHHNPGLPRFPRSAPDRAAKVFRLRSLSLAQYDYHDGENGGVFARIIWKSPTAVRIEVSPRDRCFNLYFVDDLPKYGASGHEQQAFYVHVHFRNINGKIGLYHNGKRLYLVLHLRNPPLLYRLAERSGEGMSAFGLSTDPYVYESHPSAEDIQSEPSQSTTSAVWDRTIDYTSSRVFGDCDIYLLELCSAVQVGEKSDEDLLRFLVELRLIDHKKLEYKHANKVQFDEVKIFTDIDFLSQKRRFDGSHRQFNSLPFSVRYMLQTLVSAGAFYERNITSTMITYLHRVVQSGKERLAVKALDMLLRDSTASWHNQPLEDIKYNIEILEKTFDPVLENDEGHSLDTVGTKLTPVRRVSISPLKMSTWKAEYEVSNRVLRRFSKLSDRFIRVHFTEEGFGSIFSGSGDDIFFRIREILTRGVYIAGRKFVMLAFSNSQLREHGCWLYAEGPESRRHEIPSANDIRAWMGTFSSIRVVGKYGARLGQCFSSSIGTVRVEKEEVREIDDIWDDARAHCFSDGVGMISESMADRVVQRMGLSGDTPVPSAFQVRFGGCKGMLTVARPQWMPDEAASVALRPSQQKFVSDHMELEIVGISKYMPAYLNRQLITILSTLGVEDASFIKLYEDYVAELNSILGGPRQALRVLGATGTGENISIKFTGTAPSMTSSVDMLQGGFHPQHEPHLKAMLVAWRTRMMLDLREKARILVPQGVVLYGVLDEASELEPDEVFVQYRSPGSSTPINLAGKEVFVCRNPSLHPGDIRKLRAVDCPALESLVDVVVFPARGYRPLPSQMSGGDLDGDTFMVCWDRSLMPPSERSPMDYTPSSNPKEIDITLRGVQVKHLVSFFVGYMKNDKLGQIANAHLVHADMDAKKADCDACLLLAEAHSTAVDFAKTGVPATLPSELKISRWPDFMEKEDLESYVSENILGVLYRRTKATDEANGHDGADEFEHITKDPDLLLAGREDFLAEAKSLLVRYQYEFLGICQRFGVFAEGEMMTGHVRDFARTARQRSLHGDVQARLNRNVQMLRRHYLREFLDGLKQREGWDSLSDEERTQFHYRKASAWYEVTYDAAQEHGGRRYDTLDPDEGRCLSFPWIVSKFLGGIKRNAIERRNQGGKTRRQG